MAPNLRKRSRPSEQLVNGTNGSSTTEKKRQKKNTRQDPPQASKSDGELHTVFDLIEARANDPDVGDKPILYYPSAGTEYVGYSPKELYQLASKAATYYSAFIPPRTSSEDPTLVVALLGRSTLDYFITLLGISRLGHGLLFLSPRISEEAHVSLVRGSAATHLLVDAGFQDMSARISHHLPHLQTGTIASQPEYTALSPYVPSKNLDPTKQSQNLAWIIHSSGSTSLPKPIRSTHSSALGNFKSAFNLASFVTLPLFHAQGIGWVFRGIMNKKPVYLYPAELPLTTSHLVKTLREHPDIQILLAVPYTCRLLAESEEGVELCKRLEVLFSGGAMCPKPIGDKLTRAGVNLVSHFGSTETGQLMNSFRPQSEILEWDWLRPLENAVPFFRWELYDEEKNVFELVIEEGWPAKVATNRDDGAYATSDLWERHPEWPRVNRWRYFARMDDTVVLVNGEKANPVLFEQAACENPSVQEAIVFGNERESLGMFVIPADSAEDADEVREDMWPAIERANMVMPAHAQLERSMVKVLGPQDVQRIPRTDKGNIIRAAFYRDFASLVDAAYEEHISSAEKVILEREELLSFLRSEINASLSGDRLSRLDDDTDLFSLGIDSLQASRIRSAVLKRGIDTGETTIGESFVFEFPSITAMADELIRMQQGGPTTARLSVEDRMQALIDKYTSGFDSRRETRNPHAANSVVVTGVTGSLGAHVLSQVSFRDDIAKVFCLVRARSDDQAYIRTQRSLIERRLDVDRNKMCVYACDFSKPTLGLSSKTYEDVTHGLKSIIHCAWNVNFNIGLDSFEHDCIIGLKHLINLGLRSQTKNSAEFVFCSSISAAGNANEREIPEDLPKSLTAAQRTGYAQSKLVAEHICMAAAKASGMAAKILRIGQVAGDTKFGIWNASEAVPMILKSALTIGSLPMLDEWHSWLPVDVVATVISEIAFTRPGESGVFNVVNPTSFHWTWDLLLLLREIGVHFNVEDRKKWLQRLQSMPDPVRNPPYRLIDFFEAKYGEERLAPTAVFATGRAQAASPAMKDLLALDRHMACMAVQRIMGS